MGSLVPNALCRLLPAAIIAVFLAPLAPAGALAQSSSDPPADSPPRAVYQIPLESGRADGAPRGTHSVGSNTDSSESNGGSLYRSENNFGSSSQVPNFGSSSQVPGGANSSGNPDDSNRLATDRAALAGLAETGSSAGNDSGGSSFFENPWLLALMAAVGTGLVLMGVRAWRSGQRP